MILIIDSTDFSSQVDVSNYSITPRRIAGPAQGTLTNGDHVADVVNIKRDLTMSVEAASSADASAFLQACMKEYVNLIFIDAISGAQYTGTYEPNVGSVPLAIDADRKGRRFWYGFQVQFKEK